MGSSQGSTLSADVMSLVDTLPVLAKTLIAGGAAGAFAKTAVAPLERIKILLQTRTNDFRALGVSQSLKKVLQCDGPLGFYKGNGASVIRIIPYAALHYMTYEVYRDWILENNLALGSGPIVDLVAGSAAGGTAVLCTYPLDLARTKLAYQVSDTKQSFQGGANGFYRQPTYSGIKEVLTMAYKEGGPRGLYRGIEPPDPRVRKDKNIKKKLERIWALGSLNWPAVIEHSQSCPPPCPTMGKANCSFKKYADQFVNSGAPSETVPTPDDAGGSSRGKLVVGVRKDVRITQTVEKAAENTAKFAANVAAARAAKAPASSPSGGGGSSRPPPSGDGSRKRASRERPADLRVAPEGLGLGPEGVDYTFGYNYPSKDLAFTLNPASCAELAGKIPGGFTKFPPVDSLSEAKAYTVWAQESFKAIGAGNRMIEAYESRAKDAEKGEREAKELFAKERRYVSALRKDLVKAKEEFKSLKDKYDSETGRLRSSRDSCEKVLLEKLEKCRALADRLRKHILSERAAKEDREMLIQIMGTKDCLERLIRGGVAPEEKMKQLAADEEKWRAIMDEFDIFDLHDGDLAELPAVGSSRFAADGPSRAAANGGDEALADQ